MSVHLAIARAAQQSGHVAAVRGYGFERNWAETGDRVARLASGLLSAGLSRGDRLALLAGNSAEHMELTYAAIWAGIIVVPINTRLSTPEMCQILGDCQARGIAFDNLHSGAGQAVAAELGLPVVMGLDQVEASVKFDELLTREARPPVDAGGKDLLGLYYTGGTTGRPKGVELSHAAFELTAMDQAYALECTGRSAYLHAAPYFHLADCSVGNSITYVQGTHVFSDDTSSAGILDAIRNLGVNFLSIVPTMYQDLIQLAAGDPILEQIENAVYGAAPISEGLLKQVLAAFPNARFKQCYGQTEVAGACVVLPPEAHVPGGSKLATAGKPTLSAHVRIVDADGHEAPRGVAGEIMVAGDRVMNGYWGQPEKTAETVVDGWLHTGDVGVMDEDGYVAVVDRLKDMIVTGGENVFCAEVENTLSVHPDVAAVSVVGVPDDRWGEAVHAFVVVAEGRVPEPADLIAHTKAQIAGYKCPKGISFITELPLSGVGKVRKDALRAQWISMNKDSSDV
ncbi:AMP-binding protein [Ruegeria sp.]|uniref:AMP-binding protein n=1 Tax=Ruegeria sp. TaxID=1879320 RepID=UPI003C7C0E7A